MNTTSSKNLASFSPKLHHPPGTDNTRTHNDSVARQEFRCRACGAMNWMDRTRCRTCGEPRTRVQAIAHADPTNKSNTQTTGRGKGKGQGRLPPWRQRSSSSDSRTAASASPSASPATRTPTTSTAQTRGKAKQGQADKQDHHARIKNLEAIRRSARAAGEHTLADQLTKQIDDLRKEYANMRPLHERVKSAEAKLELAQQEVTRANDLLTRAQERKEAATKHLAETTHELESLRQQQLQQPQHSEDPDPTLEHLLAYFDELADAVEATPAAKTARIYAALTAVRTILLKETEHNAYSTKSEDDHSMQHSEPDENGCEDASSDHTCESASASPSTRGHSPSRARSTREIPHYHISRDSDSEGRAIKGRGKRRSRSTSIRNRSRSPIA